MSARSKRRRTTGRRSSSIKKRLIWATALGLILVIVVSGLIAATSRLGSPDGQSVAAGPAPDITLATEAGDFQLSDLQGQVVLLYFSFPGWPTCAASVPVLARLQSEYGDQGLRVLAINIESRNYTLAEWTAFMKQFEPAEFAGLAERGAVQDATNQTIQAYQLKALGTEVIVDRQGQVTFRRETPAGYDKLRSEIENAL